MCESKHLWMLCLLFACGGELRGEVDGHKFVRCAQSKPAAERSYRAGGATVTVQERVLQVDAPSVKLAAFTGPVDHAFTSADLKLLRDDKPTLAVMLGGSSEQNLAQLAALHIPLLFIAGGADRQPAIEAAFAALPEADRDWVINGSGLRELRVGSHHFAIVAGAALGRYAIDDDACGFTGEDLSAIQTALPSGAKYLLSWQGTQGSPELSALAKALGVQAELHAFPEPLDAVDVAAVPRLGSPGTQRADGTRLRSQVSRWELASGGLKR